MRLNLFAHHQDPEPEPQGSNQPGATVQPPMGLSFPADEVVWGIVIRNGFDELDDPGYHRGTTQHAYLEGNDNVAICGFRPPLSGPRTRRRARLGLPTAGEHPMCGSCARMVVAPRPRVPVPVRAARPPVPVPVSRPPQPVFRAAVAAPATAAGPGAPLPPAPLGGAGTAPWLRDHAPAPEAGGISIDLGSRHDGGLLKRGVHTESESE